MTTRALKITTCFAALIAAAVIGASPALAAPAPGSRGTTNTPVLEPVNHGSRGMTGQPLSLPHVDHSILVLHRTSPVSNATGFSWTDAGIGAMTATVASIVLIGLLLLDMRRRRVPTAA